MSNLAAVRRTVADTRSRSCVSHAAYHAIPSAAAAEVAKMDWESEWDDAVAYSVSDVVQHLGSSWIAIQAGTNHEPPTLPTTANAYWELVTAKGDRGYPGAVAGAAAGIRIYNPDETTIPLGNVTIESSFRGDVTFDRFYGRITHHDGAAQITVGFYVNGDLVHSALVDESGAVEDTGLSIAAEDGDTIVAAILFVSGDVWGFEARLDSPKDDPFAVPVTFGDAVTFEDVATFPAGSAAAPAIQGPGGQGIHFPTNKVGLNAEGVNFFRGGKDDLTLTLDTVLVVARTTGSPGHGYPQIALRNEDKTTRNGAGGFIRFQSYNSSDALVEAQINGGAVIATAGAEQSGFDFGGLRNGVYESMFAVSAYETMFGPTVDGVYDLARSSYRMRHGYFSGAVRVGSYTVGTVPSASALGAGASIYVSNETGGAVIAFSDGTNWRRVTDRTVIS